MDIKKMKLFLKNEAKKKMLIQKIILADHLPK